MSVSQVNMIISCLFYLCKLYEICCTKLKHTRQDKHTKQCKTRLEE